MAGTIEAAYVAKAPPETLRIVNGVQINMAPVRDLSKERRPDDR